MRTMLILLGLLLTTAAERASASFEVRIEGIVLACNPEYVLLTTGEANVRIPRSVYAGPARCDTRLVVILPAGAMRELKWGLPTR